MANVRKARWTYKGVTKEVWIVEYVDLSGKRRQRTPKSGLKKDAELMRQAIERELGDGTHTARMATVTFAYAADEWLRDCERRYRIKDKMSGHTLAGYRSQSKDIVEHFGGRKLVDVTALMIQGYINELSERVSWGTLHLRRVIISRVLRFAVRQKWLKRDPTTDEPVRMPDDPTGPRAIPTKKEIQQLLSVLAVRRKGEQRHAYRNRLIAVLLALFAGMRRGEICGLQWENVDFAKGAILIRHSLSSYDGLKAPKTRAGVRTIPMAPVLAEGMARYHEDEGSPTTGFVLKDRGGGPVHPHSFSGGPKQATGLWTNICRDAGWLKPEGGAKYSFHALRHAAVSLWIDQGLSAMHIKLMIGHEKITTTIDTYGHLFPEDERSRLAVAAAADQFKMPSIPMIAELPAPPRSRGNNGKISQATDI